jgi:hypothetical protein
MLDAMRSQHPNPPCSQDVVWWESRTLSQKRDDIMTAVIPGVDSIPYTIDIITNGVSRLQTTKRPPAESWWVQKLSADFTAD